MAEPALSPAGEIVRRYDPELFHAALFAAEPRRERLMILYAYDIELSRAAARAERTEQGPLIARMRLQFWRDTLEEAFAGAEPRKHEVAEPLTRLIRDAALPRDALEAMIDARDVELEGVETQTSFDRWAEGRFSALTSLALWCLDWRGRDAAAVARDAGAGAARAFALRLAMPMAIQAGIVLLPALDADGHAALRRGETTPALAAVARAMARDGSAFLAAARAHRPRVPRSAQQALLHLWRADADLAAMRVQHIDLATGFPDPSGARRSLVLLWRALRGRW